MANAVLRKCTLRRFLQIGKYCEVTCTVCPVPLRSSSQRCLKSPITNSQNIFSMLRPNYNLSVKLYSNDKKDDDDHKPEKKLSIFQRFRQMYRDYWYVLVPVHLVTSAAWFGGFYYMAKSGVDVVALLESLNISSKITSPLKDSSMGYIAIAYALYKIATPARYTVTLGGTTISINYLKKWGYIKPVPSPEKLKEIYMEQRDNLLETMRETKADLMTKADKIKDQRDNIIGDLERSIKKIKDKGESARPKKKDSVSNESEILDDKGQIIKDLETSIKNIKATTESMEKTKEDLVENIEKNLKVHKK